MTKTPQRKTFIGCGGDSIISPTWKRILSEQISRWIAIIVNIFVVLFIQKPDANTKVFKQIDRNNEITKQANTTEP